MRLGKQKLTYTYHTCVTTRCTILSVVLIDVFISKVYTLFPDLAYIMQGIKVPQIYMEITENQSQSI